MQIQSKHFAWKIYQLKLEFNSRRICKTVCNVQCAYTILWEKLCVREKMPIVRSHTTKHIDKSKVRERESNRMNIKTNRVFMHVLQSRIPTRWTEQTIWGMTGPERERYKHNQETLCELSQRTKWNLWCRIKKRKNMTRICMYIMYN